MKAVLKTDVTFTELHVRFGARLNGNDDSTHLVTVKGHASHGYVWKSEEQEKFSFEFFADKEFCKIIEVYLEKRMGLGAHQDFPREDTLHMPEEKDT